MFKNMNINKVIIHCRNGVLNLNTKKNRTIPKINYELFFKCFQDFPDVKLIPNGEINNTEIINNFKKNNIIYTIYGFIPSLIAFFIMVLNVLNYEKYFLFSAIIIFLLLQLFIDYLLYLNNKISSSVIYYLRIPVTLTLSGLLLISILVSHP